MDALSNDLTKPLGVDQAAPTAWRLRAPIARALAGVLGAAVAGLGLYGTFANDPFGGEPYALVPIEGAAPGARVPPAPDRDGPRNDAPQEPAPTEPRARSTAAELEAASGVSVVRPQGAGAPGSLIIQVPDDLGGKLKPAPDKRLVERTREGALPKIGPDGSRPSEVYARPAVLPAGGARTMPRVAIVVAGLGVGQTATADAIAKLPVSVTLAFTPYGSDVERDAARAREEGHEVMLQAPMEPFDYPDNDPGPHTLTVRAKPDDNIGRLHWAMARFPGYIGLINFMGAKLTADEAALAPILREIGGRGLVFVDDGSSPRSLVPTVGASVDLSTARADFVLDGVPRPDAVDKQLERLEQMARQRGFALGSASALPVTLDRIARWAKTLEMRGVLLVPVSSAFGKEARR